MSAKRDLEQVRRDKLAEESMNLVLQRGGVTKQVLLKDAMHRFFNRYYQELLTPAEQRKYACVIG